MAGENKQTDQRLLSREDLPKGSWTDVDSIQFMMQHDTAPRPISGPEAAWLEDEKQKPTITTQ